jgi:hypothetical protein
MPPPVSGYFAAYDGATSLRATNGAVTQWDDSSTNAWHVTANSAGETPTLTSVNGLTAVRFTAASGQWLRNTAISPAAANTGTWYAVIRAVGTVQYDRILSLVKTGGGNDFDNTQSIGAISRHTSPATYGGLYNSNFAVGAAVASVNEVHVITAQRNGDSYSIWVDGVPGTGATGLGTTNFAFAEIRISAGAGGAFDGDICEVAAYTPVHAGNDLLANWEYFRSKWQVPSLIPQINTALTSQIIVPEIVLVASDPPTPSGSLSTTNANDTISAAGGTGPSGTLAKTNANDTSAASGGTGPSGTLAKTNQNDTSSAAGGTGPSGTLAKTNANDTLAAAGGAGPSGTLAVTEAHDTSNSAGGGGASGTLNVTNADDTLSAEGGPLDVEPEPEASTSAPGGRKNFDPSRETRDYWERERHRIASEASLAAILADDEEVLVLM